MDLHVSVKAETLWEIDLGPLGTLNFTNSLLQMLIVMAVIIIVGALIARRASIDKPGKAQSVLELVVEFLLNLVESAAGRRVGRRIFPLIGSLFIFIIISNYSGLLPGVGTIECLSLCGYEEEHTEDEEAHQVRIASVETDSDATPIVALAEEGEDEEHHAPPMLLRAPNADLNMTLALSLVTFTAVQIAGIAAHGVGGRIKHLGDPPFMFPIEVISEFSRIISLSFRLFGNIFAGEVLVGVMIAMSVALGELLGSWGIVLFGFLPVVFLLLEVLFGFIQALIFALLTLIYISLAGAGHDDHGHIHEPGEGHGHDHGHGSNRVPVAAGAGGD